VPTLRTILDEKVREADPSLYEKLENNRLRCFSCGHCCPISEGQPGVCKVRFNRGGKLYVPWGYTAGTQCDPVEKKPFFHAHPGALAYSFGMLGCDLHCAYCQNWVTSQALRDPNAVSPPHQASPEKLVDDALAQGAKILVSTYNEPLITSEDVAAWLRVTPEWVRRMRVEGIGPPFEILPMSGWIRYRPHKLREWLEERSVKSTSQYRAKGMQKGSHK